MYLKTNNMKKFLPKHETKIIDNKSIIPKNVLRLLVIIFSLFLFETQMGYGQDCNIVKIDCPPTVVNICADKTMNGFFGTNVSWIEPKFRLDCNTAVPGEDYSFYIEFNLPEGKNSC